MYKFIEFEWLIIKITNFPTMLGLEMIWNPCGITDHMFDVYLYTYTYNEFIDYIFICTHRYANMVNCITYMHNAHIQSSKGIDRG